MPSRTITLAILALPGVQMLDACGPLDVFAEANRQAGHQAYRLLLLACEPGPLISSAGTGLIADGWVGEKVETIDTLLVAGTPNAADQYLRPGILEWLRQRAQASRRYGSVCTGAFALAAAGLLDNRRVTTHWAVAETLAQRYPQLRVEADALLVRDGKLRTAAGVTAGLDLALALVEEDLGVEIAKQVASQLVMYFKRPGGQLQFSREREASSAGRSVLQDLQRYVAANPALDHGIASLAERAGLSSRHFARVFQREMGVTPAAWVEQVRVNAARVRLETGREAPKQVAAACGFANADTLRRAFVRYLGVTPAEYRKRHGGGGWGGAEG